MTDKRPLIILGSARHESDTRRMTEQLFAGVDHKLVDLLDQTIYPYNYLEKYPDDDDFLSIARQFLLHQHLVFATPVYWYAMSGTMKILFDRFSDLVGTQKQMGRKLKSKSVFLVAVGAQRFLPEGFEVPFRETAKYLDMVFRSTYYCQNSKIALDTIEQSTFLTALKDGSRQQR